MASMTVTLPTLAIQESQKRDLRTIEQSLDKAAGILSAGKKLKVDQKGFERHMEVFEKLHLQLTQSEQAIEAQTSKGKKIDPKILAAHRELLGLLGQIAQKISPVYRAVMFPHIPVLPEQETPLHWAVRHHRYEDVITLRKMGDSYEIPDADGVTALNEAVMQNDRKMIDLLLLGHLSPQETGVFKRRVIEAKNQIQSLFQIDMATLSPACVAAIKGTSGDLQGMKNLGMPDQHGLTPLHYALLSGNEDTVNYLKNVTRLQDLTPQGHTYFDYAIASGNLSLYQAFERLNLPSRLSEGGTLLPYLIASSLLIPLLQQEAARRDPLAIGQGIRSIDGAYISSISTVLIGMFGAWLQGSPITDSSSGWTARMCSGIGSFLNESSQLFKQNLAFSERWSTVRVMTEESPFPALVSASTSIYQVGLLGYIAVRGLLWIGGYNHSSIIPTPVTLLNSQYPGAGDVAWKLFNLLGVCSVAKATLPKLAGYWKAFPSRPRQVLQTAAYDAFALGMTVFRGYESWPATA